MTTVFEPFQSSAPPVAEPSAEPVKRKRGRPPKAAAPAAATKPRGRPRKAAVRVNTDVPNNGSPAVQYTITKPAKPAVGASAVRAASAEEHLVTEFARQLAVLPAKTRQKVLTILCRIWP